MIRMVRTAFTVAALVGFPIAASAESTFHSETYSRTTTTSSSYSLNFYSSETAAQKHCPRDTVVWLNTHTGIWHLRGERWYGRTREGAYVCEQEAAAAGDRETENGQ